MELRVLDGDRELAGERSQERRLVGAQLSAAREIGREQADQLLAGDERHREHRVHRCLAGRFAHGSHAQVRLRVGHVQHPLRAQRPESELEQPLGDRQLRAPGRAPGLRAQPRSLAQIDRDAVGAEQL